VDIAAYTQARGQEALVAADDDDLVAWLDALRARKVFQQTKVLFPTNQGLPASCSVGSVWDLDDLRERLGVGVTTIGLQELAEEMDLVLASPPTVELANREAEELFRRAQKSFIQVEYVAKSLLFRRAVENLMQRHGCTAFTIECFEFCSSRLPERWQITPCLIHSLFRNAEMASSCEGDLGSLLAMRLLMSVSGKSCHQGNSDPRTADAFSINHSVPSMKMNGFDQPDVPYQLGRFVQSGWGTKVVVDFMQNDEKAVTVARVNPLATKLLVLRGELSGSSGWDQDLIGCSVAAIINPPSGRTDEFLRKRLEYGNHLQWVYGDHTRQMQRVGELLKLGVEVIS
jgi:L-fucose isomerase-like protein